MSKYKFIKIKDEANKFDTTDVTIESVSVGLPELLEDITDFLKACGFSLDGLEAVHEED